MVEFRPLASTDSIPALTALLHAAYRPLAEAGMRYHASFQDDEITRQRCEKGETYLGLRGNEIVSTITLASVANTRGTPWYDRPDVASVGQFAVRPDLGRQGIGSQMMDLVEARARELGIAELALDTSECAEHLIRWYTARGYRFIEHVQWDITNYRSVILSKSLS